MLDFWMQEAVALLAEIPHLADRDLEARQAYDTSALVRRQRDAEVKRRQLKRARRDAEALHQFVHGGK